MLPHKQRSRPPAKKGGPATNRSPKNTRPPGRDGRPIDNILPRLDRVRRSADGWMAACPSHDDKNPSLSIAENQEGKVVLYCFAGCATEDVVKATGLTMADLFPSTSEGRARFRRPVSSPPYAMPKSDAEVLLESATFAESWELSKTLARVPEQRARRHVLSSWDYLTDRFDIPAVLSLARLVRGIALFRYCDSKSVEDPNAVARAVRRLINDIETWGDRSGSSVVPGLSPHSQQPPNTTARSEQHVRASI